MTSKTSSYREPLILIAFVALGAVLGIVLGEKAAFLYPIGQIWLNMLFVLLVPLIFFSISSSIAGITDTRRVGKMLALTTRYLCPYSRRCRDLYVFGHRNLWRGYLHSD